VDRATPAANPDLDAVRRVNEVERVEVARVTEDGVRVDPTAGAVDTCREVDLGRPLDGVATARTERAGAGPVTHWRWYRVEAVKRRVRAPTSRATSGRRHRHADEPVPADTRSPTLQDERLGWEHPPPL
jgi:hypothetical protein